MRFACLVYYLICLAATAGVEKLKRTFALMIEFKRVNKYYGAHHVLRDITLTVSRGEVVVVCGPSGSGKSTLIKCVNALEPYQNGLILVDGIDVGSKTRSAAQLRRRVGMVFQKFRALSAPQRDR